MHKLAIITTHPIQYYAPIFRLLNSEQKVEVKVFYTYEKVKDVFDEGFGKSFTWDIPLLDGYNYTFVSNNGNIKKGFWNVSNPTLNKEIEDWGATAVLIFGWNFRSHLSAMRYFKGKIPVLFRGDSTLLDEVGWLKKMLRRLFLSWVYKYVDYALYVGKANKKYYQYCGLKENQLVFAPHAIDNERFSQLTTIQQDFIHQTHTQFGVKANHIGIVFCGKFQQKKNPSLLIEAFKKLSNINCHLFMVGNGELEDELRKQAKGYNNIHLLPFQNQSLMPAVYRLGQIFCLPSSGPGETWGLAVNEAMACKRTVIVSDKCGCAEDLVTNGENGFAFNNNDATLLSSILQKVCSNREDLNRMSESSFTKIQTWNFKNITQSIYAILN